RVYTDLLNTVIFVNNKSHLHSANAIKLEVRKGYEDLRYRAINSNEPPANIVANSFGALSTLAQAQLPSKHNLKRLVKHHPSINAITKLFPTCVPSGCFFHLRQSLYRQVKTLGWKNRYDADPLFAYNCTRVAALAFLPLQDVIVGFVFLSEDLTLDLQDFLNYFEDTYIGHLRASSVRANPKFAVELWNMHSRTDQAMLRSNNHVEGWHNKLHKSFQCEHPTLLFSKKSGPDRIHTRLGHHARPGSSRGSLGLDPVKSLVGSGQSRRPLLML
ncbi:unnamed protein product, partial [Didymodactylos carnosus]